MPGFGEYLVVNKDLLGVVFSLFGTGAAILLGLMALVLTRAANKNGQAQTKLLERQTMVAEQQLLPLWRLVRKTLGKTDSAYDAVEIWNDGAPVTLGSILQYSFLEVEVIGAAPNERPVRHIAAYYFHEHRYSSGEQRGLVAVLTAYKTPPLYSRQPFNVTAALRRLQENLKSSARLTVRVSSPSTTRTNSVSRTEPTMKFIHRDGSGQNRVWPHRLPNQGAARLPRFS
jgi:hypothetical protein